MLNRMRSGVGQGLVIALIGGLAACGDDEGGPAAPDVGTPVQLTFVTEASDVTAGAAITPALQVAIRDASSNLVTSATDAVTVELASNPGGGTLMGTTTVNAVGGVATFSDLSIDKVGSGLSLRATSGNLQSATTASFVVSPGAPAALAFRVEPSAAEVNLAMAPAVEVGIEDEFGNAVTTATNAVTLAIGTNPGGGTLTGTTTVDAVGGVASFADLVIDKTGGGYTLVATSGALTQVTSAFDVTFPIAAVSAGEGDSCGLTTGGNGYCWGDNFRGQLGDGTTTGRLTPVLVSGSLSFALLSALSDHTCGITTGGDTYCWGLNDQGQLGDGTTTDRVTPVLVSGGLSFASLSSGENHTCGLTTGGIAYCWGRNDLGQLGDGTTTERLTPVLVSGGLSFASLNAGGGQGHTCGLTTGGEAYCWGRNFDGQLGDGTTTNRLAPVLVSSGQSFTALSAGGFHSCGVTTGGDAYCWGENFFGELGDGTTTDRLTPVLVSGSLSFASLSAGSSHSCGLTTGGNAYCWGRNTRGQLGDGTTTGRLTPVLVTGGLSFASLNLGDPHSCALAATGGGAYCWGSNFSGQLGDGTTTDRSTPVRVSDP